MDQCKKGNIPLVWAVHILLKKTIDSIEKTTENCEKKT